jgi:uncharacterized protein YbjT (DUF2867 family)
MSSPKTILFLGATGGCGLSALRRSLAADHTCIALCRTPSKLTAILPLESHPNLTVIEGNAHDSAALIRGLVNPANPTRTVDVVLTSIGSAFNLKNFGMEDSKVCENGMKTLLDALTALRQTGVTGQPRIIAVSSTGVSKFERDIPLVMLSLYRVIAAPAHKDKRIMEDLLAASAEEWTIVRPSLLTDGAETQRQIRAGVEDPVKGVEKREIGYTISREDVGRWISEVLLGNDKAGTYVSKIASITY